MRLFEVSLLLWWGSTGAYEGSRIFAWLALKNVYPTIVVWHTRERLEVT